MLKKLCMFLFFASLSAADNDNQKNLIMVTNQLAMSVTLQFGRQKHALGPGEEKAIKLNKSNIQDIILWIQSGCRNNDMVIVSQKLIEGGSYTIACEQKGSSRQRIIFSQDAIAEPFPLHKAVSNHNLMEAICLIKQGAELNQQDDCKSTPLHCAAVTGYINMLKMLLNREKSLNIDAQDDHGATPLLVALVEGHESFAMELIFAGANVNLAANNGLAPLHVAAEGGFELAVDSLLRHGANLLADGKDPSLECDNGFLPIDCTKDEAIYNLLYEAMNKKTAERTA